MQIDEQAVQSLKTEVGQVLRHTNRADMKEIKGLEERLCGLEQLMVETKKIVQEQSDLTQVQITFKFSVIADLTPHFVLPSLVLKQPLCSFLQHVPSYVDSRCPVVQIVWNLFLGSLFCESRCSYSIGVHQFATRQV